MFNLNASMRYWLYGKSTDMRKSFHTLSGLVKNDMGMDVRNSDVFIFINSRHNRIKLLHMEPGGLVIYSKLLEEGTFKLPTIDPSSGKLSIEWLDLVMLVEGIRDDPKTRLKRLRKY